MACTEQVFKLCAVNNDIGLSVEQSPTMYRHMLLDDVQWSESAQQVEYDVGVDCPLGLIR